jgi:hypothetical protein
MTGFSDRIFRWIELNTAAARTTVAICDFLRKPAKSSKATSTRPTR